MVVIFILSLVLMIAGLAVTISDRDSIRLYHKNGATEIHTRDPRTGAWSVTRL